MVGFQVYSHRIQICKENVSFFIFYDHSDFSCKFLLQGVDRKSINSRLSQLHSVSFCVKWPSSGSFCVKVTHPVGWEHFLCLWCGCKEPGVKWMFWCLSGSSLLPSAGMVASSSAWTLQPCLHLL